MGDMGILPWLTENAFNFVNAIGIVGGLCFTGYSLRSETKTRRVANLLALADAHRSIWKEHLKYPQLARVLESRVDLLKEPITREEEIFVNLVIQHVSVVFHTMQNDLTVKPEGWRRDIAAFFSLPIPQVIWDRLKGAQNDRFVSFVEACINWK